MMSNQTNDDIKEILQEFEKTDARLSAFSFITNELLGLHKEVVIVETGCVRQAGNWSGDGQSTVVFDRIVNRCGGKLTSIDISPESCAVARRLVPNANVICADSIATLRSLLNAESIDLLYLDSYDATGHFDSPLHHMGELAAIYTRLKDGCMIAIDDCFDGGKHKYVARFFEDIGIKPLIEGYITVWRKS